MAGIMLDPSLILLTRLLRLSGLRKAVGPKLVTVKGRDLLRHMAAEFENAVEHAAQEAKRPGRGDAARGQDQPPEGAQP